ncbi:alpha/beta fold hydrolase [Kribbella turkmenica]|uniref:Alpha/beta fold hydrolase n=1 Tax=Kribbella turkmenica TaxID=2530375 RepID=A0A4R4WA18_9ACTN|nr:alpha/beta fold hydrolase [Kribbella turkmenica]TDD15618.1 alpha/beta fold hydrolase [Kribbella turkmenica]
MSTLAATVDGPPDAPSLVLGPSLGTGTGLFDVQVASLAAKYRIIRFDLPGHGRSPTWEGPFLLEDLATAVLRMLDQLGVDRFHYAGVSLGGAIGQQLAVSSARLDSLTLMATAGRFPAPESWPARAELVLTSGTEALVPSRYGTWFTQEYADANPAEAERLIAMLRSTSPVGYAACCEAIAAFDLRDRLGTITVPTLVIAGQDDPATPPDTVRALADAIPPASFVAAAGAHLINIEAASAVTRLLDRQLARADSLTDQRRTSPALTPRHHH